MCSLRATSGPLWGYLPFGLTETRFWKCSSRIPRTSSCLTPANWARVEIDLQMRAFWLNMSFGVSAFRIASRE
ncbi:hypothetical protein LCGC14_2472660, partial [marine sediment metagenome]